MKSIVYATDCSQNSVAALRMGYALSQQLNAKFIILHVFDVNTPVLTSLSITASRKENEALEEHHRRVITFYETHIGMPPDPGKVHIAVQENNLIHEAITKAVIDFQASLLLMGTRGKSALKTIIIGSTTQEMITKSPCALLMVPPALTTYTLDKITYATDFEEVDLAAIDWLVKTLAIPCKAQVHVLHVVNNQEENKGNDLMPWFKEMLQQKVKYKNLILTSVHSENIFQALASYPEQEEMDLLVMLKREKPGFLPSLFRTDLVKKMFSKTNAPLLSIHKALLQ